MYPPYLYIRAKVSRNPYLPSCMPILVAILKVIDVAVGIAIPEELRFEMRTELNERVLVGVSNGRQTKHQRAIISLGQPGLCRAIFDVTVSNMMELVAALFSGHSSAMSYSRVSAQNAGAADKAIPTDKHIEATASGLNVYSLLPKREQQADG